MVQRRATLKRQYICSGQREERVVNERIQHTDVRRKLPDVALSELYRLSAILVLNFFAILVENKMFFLVTAFLFSHIIELKSGSERGAVGSGRNALKLLRNH